MAPQSRPTLYDYAYTTATYSPDYATVSRSRRQLSRRCGGPQNARRQTARCSTPATKLRITNKSGEEQKVYFKSFSFVK